MIARSTGILPGMAGCGPNAGCYAAPVDSATALLVLAQIGAPADGPMPLSVDRTRGADCPDAAALVTKTSASGAKRPFVSGGGSGFRVVFVRDNEKLRATIEAPGGRSRVLEESSSSCEGLADAVVVALVLASDAETDGPARPPPRETEAPPTASTVAPRWPLARLSAGGAASIGVVRDVAPAVIAGVHLGPRSPFRGGLLLTIVPTQTLGLGRGAVDVRYLAVSPEACFSFHPSFEGCGRVEIGRLSGEASGFVQSEAHDRIRFAAGPVARGILPLSKEFMLFAEASALFPTQKERFGVDGVGVAYDPLPVGIGVGAGLGLSIE